jgi:hypothetical protein
MRFLNLYRAAAALYVPAVFAFGLAGGDVPEGAVITDPHDLRFYILAGTALLVAGLVSWVGAVQFWLHRRRAHLSSELGAVLLVPFGFLIGWVYVLGARDPADK